MTGADAMRPTFVAVDVETANSDPGSICQIGTASYANGRLVDEWATLVDPEEPFDYRNIAIHGIDEYRVGAAPTFRECVRTLNLVLAGQVVVHHTAFDLHALSRACAAVEVALPQCDWLDSAKVARRAWPQFARRGYALANISRFLDYQYQHHDALEDAKAAGNLIIAACRETGVGLPGWLASVRQPRRRPMSPRPRRGRRAERP